MLSFEFTASKASSSMLEDNVLLSLDDSKELHVDDGIFIASETLFNIMDVNSSSNKDVEECMCLLLCYPNEKLEDQGSTSSNVIDSIGKGHNKNWTLMSLALNFTCNANNYTNASNNNSTYSKKIQ